MRRNTIKTWNYPKILLFVFLFLLTGLFGVYSYISISPTVFGKNIQEFALTRNTYSKVLKAKRGTIYDTDGNVLALNVYSYTVIAYLDSSRTTNPERPQHVVDKELTAEKLSPLLNMEVSTIYNLLTKENLYQVELGPGGRNISELKKEAIEELNLPGIDFIESSKRFYPNGDFASYIIGYAKTNEHKNEETGKIENIIDGELGIEAKYDTKLKGKDGYISYQQDAKGYKIPETPEEKIEAVNGNDIYLTINSSIQRFLEETMDKAEEKYNYEWLQFHIMDAKTGDILGTASSPSFDPNIREISNYENNLIYVIEPGSVMKTFTYMCAMEKGNYKGDKTYMSGTIVVGDTYIKDWNNYGWGEITYDYGYVQSSNVAITNILLNEKFIDENDLRNCLQKYGFGSSTNIFSEPMLATYKNISDEEAKEITNRLADPNGKIKFVHPIEIATAGFGQGIYVTPLQIMQGYTIVANDGKMLKPHIVKKIVDSNTGDIIYEREKEESLQLVSRDTILKMRELMNQVVNSPTGSGGGYSATKYGIDLIGKTGTAQIYENGSYIRNQYIRSFVGMFPKDDPKIIIYAAVKKVNPDSNAVLNNGVKEIVQNIAKYYNIYSSRDDNSLREYKIENYINKLVSNVNPTLKDQGINVVTLGTGEYIIDQYPKEGSTILEGEKIYLLTNNNDYIMPDMHNWSRSDVINYLDLIGSSYNISGNGYVISQSISPGTPIDKNSNIEITLNGKY